MTKRKNKLADLWQLYINQPQRPSDVTSAYVMALRARIDLLEIEIAIVKGELRRARGEENGNDKRDIQVTGHSIDSSKSR